MNRPILLLYGVICYALFNISFLYLVGFLTEQAVPKAINDGAVAPLPLAMAVNLGLIFLFGFFHSLMAREWFKSWWTRIVSKDAERSTYVLQSAVFLGLAMWQWQPMPQTLWQVEGLAAAGLYSLFSLGIVTVLISTFLIDHFELFGLRHVWSANRAEAMPAPVFRTPFLYRIVRHPMQLGVTVAVFATPHMTLGHLLFASAMTLYIIIGLHFEERALVREFGDAYRDYQRRVPMLLPVPKLIKAPSRAAS
ncbi:MAG: methanethiol S-methyltransferase [Pseudomonadota bacterium]